MFNVAHLVELACLWEAFVPKPGNVHPDAAFSNMNYDDFVRSAHAIVPVFERSASLSVGELILRAVQATHKAVSKNTNLGIILMLTPLAKATSSTRQAVQVVLNGLTIQDARLTYQAIRLAQPGGMGKVESQDVHDEPTITLLDAMRLGQDRDIIARQYATGYHDLFTLLLPALEGRLPLSPELGIQYCFLQGLAQLGDTLIARKCGLEMAQLAQAKARQVLNAGWPDSQAGQQAFTAFDTWLRADGHRRNPGTMADLIAGTVFLALRRGSMPARYPVE